MVNLGIRIVDDSFCSVVDMNVYSFFLRAVGCPKYGGSRGPDGVPTTIVVVEANRAVGFCEDFGLGILVVQWLQGRRHNRGLAPRAISTTVCAEVLTMRCSSKVPEVQMRIAAM